MMNDYIKREDAKQLFLNHMGDEFPQSIKEQIVEKAFEELSSSAGVVEVVRCKDCKWWTKQEDSLQGRCALMQSYPTGAWYCANGEREDDE